VAYANQGEHVLLLCLRHADLSQGEVIFKVNMKNLGTKAVTTQTRANGRDMTQKKRVRNYVLNQGMDQGYACSTTQTLLSLWKRQCLRDM
jgi:hypothetical protein